jgi:hypothetical protein
LNWRVGQNGTPPTVQEKWQTRGPSKATKETVMEQLLLICRNLEYQNTTPLPPTPPALLPSALTSTSSNIDTTNVELQQQVNAIQQDLAEIKAALTGKKALNITTWSNIAAKAPPQADRKTSAKLITQIQK